MKKRLLSVLMVVALLVSMVPAIALADVTAEETGGHTVSDHADWTAWESTTSLPLTTGNYYLTQDVTLSGQQTISTANADIVLCLNGHTVTGAANARVYLMNAAGVHLTITDCQETAGAIIASGERSDDYGGFGIQVNNSGTLDLYRVTVDASAVTTPAGGTAIRGGGSATINIHSGIVIGGTTTGNGGTVFVQKTLNLYGGEICSGTARQGGNVFVDGNAAFTMTGGTIRGGTASDTAGGNVRVNGAMTMSGGLITDGSAGGSSKAKTANMQIVGGSFSMSGGMIAGGVNQYSGTVNFSGTAKISAVAGGLNLSKSLSANALIFGDLEDGAEIYVAHNNKEIFATASGFEAADAAYVKSSNPIYSVELGDGMLIFTHSVELAAGVGRADITPTETILLGGYGDANRYSTTVASRLYATCVAVTDLAGATVLLIACDMGDVLVAMGDSARLAISEATGVAATNIFINASHSHSVPDLWNDSAAVTAYKTYWENQLVAAAEAAMADRAPTTICAGSTETDGLNWVRRYIMADGSYAGDNFGDWSQEAVSHETEADETLQLLRFDRVGEKSILLANYQAHPTVASYGKSGSAEYYQISSDFVGAFRDYMESNQNCVCAYYQGAAGNVNSHSQIDGETYTTNAVTYGQRLGMYANSAWNNLKQVDGGKIRVSSETYPGEVNHSEDSKLSAAQEIQDYFDAHGNDATCKAMCDAADITSIYHAQAIIRKAGYEDTMELVLRSLSIGDVGFAAVPYEMFDTNGEYIKANSPFTSTFILGYTNGYYNYVPDSEAYGHGGYEANVSIFTGNSGDQFADNLLGQLAAIYDVSDSSLQVNETACDHLEHTSDAWTAWTATNSLPTTTGNYYLTDNVTLTSAQSISNSEAVTLCLNGYTVTQTGSARVYLLQGTASLTITDCSDMPGVVTGSGSYGSTSEGGIIQLNGSSTLNLYRATLDASSVSIAKGAAIKSGGSGTVNIYSGTVIGGTVSGNGGAIYSENRVRVYGGEIRGGNAIGNGGAIYIDASGDTLTVTGAAAVSGSASKGGAIYAGAGAQVHLSGTATVSGSAAYGGGIYANSAAITMTGGVISEGAATNAGGNVYLAGTATAVMTGGTITDGTIDGETAASSANVAMTGSATLTLTGGTVDGGLSVGTGSLRISGAVQISDNGGGLNFTSASNANQIVFGDLSNEAEIYVTRNNAMGDVFGVYAGLKGADVTHIHSTDAENYTTVYVTDDDEYAIGHVHCVCGDGVCAAGDHSHDVVAWTGINSLPNTTGYYYLTSDVTLKGQWNISGSNAVVLCLNGYTITQEGSNRMFLLSDTASLTITDCAAEPGRLVGGSSYTGEGGIVQLNGSSRFTLYRATLDASAITSATQGAAIKAGGGGTISIYSGTVLGGNVTGGGGAIYTNSALRVYGGEIRGGSAGGNAAANTANVQLVGANASLTMTGGAIDGGVNLNNSGSVSTAMAAISGTAQVSGNAGGLNFASNVTAANVVFGDLVEGAAVYVTRNVSDTFATYGGSGTADATRLHSTDTANYSAIYTDGTNFLFGHHHCVCGDNACDAGDHSHNSMVWTAWTATNSLPTETGNYYLTGDVTLTATWSIPAGKDIVLCLSGHTVTGPDNKRLCIYSGASTLTITDCAEESGSIVAGSGYTGEGAMFLVNYASTFNLYRATIDASAVTASSQGAAIKSGGSGIIKIYSGTVIGGTATGNGGAIFTQKTVYLYGGEIRGGTAQNGGNIYCSGNATALYLYGGTISGGTATGSGGNISTNGAVHIFGGSITGGNASSRANSNIQMQGGSSFEMTGGSVAGGVEMASSVSSVRLSGTARITADGVNGVRFGPSNNASNVIFGDFADGAEIYITRNTAAASLAIASYNAEGTAGADATATHLRMANPDASYTGLYYADGYFTFGHAHCACGDNQCAADGHTHEVFAWTAWSSTNSLPTTTGSYYLTGNVTLAATQSITTANQNIKLCLNGYNVTATMSSAKIYDITGSNVIVSITDCQSEAGTITVTNAYQSGGLITANASSTVNLYRVTLTRTGANTPGTGGLIKTSGTLNMYSGTITGGVAQSGGNVYLDGSAVMNLYGGTISNGTVTVNQGGNVFVNTNATLNMYGGAILNGSAVGDGGNVRLNGAMSMSGGEIRGGQKGGSATATTANIQMVGAKASLTMSGGSIDGGVNVNNSGSVSTAMVTLSGTAQISGNASGLNFASNVNASNVVFGDLDNDAKIYVTRNNKNTFATANGLEDGDLAYGVHSLTSAYPVITLSGTAISFTADAVVYESYADISTYRGDANTSPVKAGYIFAGWYEDASCTAPLAASSTSGAAYAKFVDPDVLTVKYQQGKALDANSKVPVRIITSVDGLDYQSVGFYLTYKNSSGAEVNRTLTATKVYYKLTAIANGVEIEYDNPADYFGATSSAFCAFILRSSAALCAQNEEGITVTPYWVTGDGTIVTGETRTDIILALDQS